VTEVSKESKSQTRSLAIKEFSVQAAAYFRKPILRSAAKIPEITTSFLNAEKLGALINPQQIKVVGDDLFNYSLQISIANGLLTILLNSEELRVSYSKGNTLDHLQIIVDLIDKAFAVGLHNPVSQYQVLFSFHGGFETREAFAKYNERFANAEVQITHGGVILVAGGRTYPGTARITLEPSAAYENALFGQSIATTTEKLNLELADKIDKRFGELFQSQGFELKFPA
jgi:hypothetical protein